MRPYKNINEQIEILYKRGIRFGSKENLMTAKRYLLTNNYYNVINGYGRYFCINTNNFPGTYFNEITYLYEFDKHIRHAFFNASIIAEQHIRSLAAYFVSEKCHNDDDNEKYLEKSFYVTYIKYVRKKLWETIDKEKNNPQNNPIKNHKNQYGYVPFWVVSNYLSFKELIDIIKNVPGIQNKIAKNLYSFFSGNFHINAIFTPDIMLSFINNIYEIRNRCAHNNRLLEYKCKQNTRFYSPLHSQFNIDPRDNRQSPYEVYLVLQCFLSQQEYAIFHNTLRKRMNYLENKLQTITIDKILPLLGFPANWNRNVSNLNQKS